MIDESAVMGTPTKAEFVPQKHPLEVYQETSGLPPSSVEPTDEELLQQLVKMGRLQTPIEKKKRSPKPKKSDSVKTPSRKSSSEPAKKQKSSKPAGNKRIPGQQLILDILGSEPMEIEELTKKFTAKVSVANPQWTMLHEFEHSEKDGKMLIYPKLSEAGAELIAKIGAKGRGHFWLRKEPKTVLAAGKRILNKSELAKLEKILGESLPSKGAKHANQKA